MKINKILKYSMVMSVAIGISGCGIVSEDESIKHNGVGYGTVKSPYTGRIWLDRNLGAKHKCKSSSDYLCFGDYYQYGRRADGHEKVVFDKNGQVLSKSELSTKQYTRINKTDSKFFSGDFFDDWLAVAYGGIKDSRSSFCSRTDGSSICPKNFHVPDSSDFDAELFYQGSAEVENDEDIFKSFLKIPKAGLRRSSDGKLVQTTEITALWTLSSLGAVFGETDTICGESVVKGVPVRCIMDEDIQEDMEDEREKERR